MLDAEDASDELDLLDESTEDKELLLEIELELTLELDDIAEETAVLDIEDTALEVVVVLDRVELALVPLSEPPLPPQAVRVADSRVIMNKPRARVLGWVTGVLVGILELLTMGFVC